MFYSQLLLSKKGALGIVWMAAHCHNRLKKDQVQQTNISSSVGLSLSSSCWVFLDCLRVLLYGFCFLFSFPPHSNVFVSAVAFRRHKFFMSALFFSRGRSFLGFLSLFYGLLIIVSISVLLVLVVVFDYCAGRYWPPFHEKQNLKLLQIGTFLLKRAKREACFSFGFTNTKLKQRLQALLMLL